MSAPRRILGNLDAEEELAAAFARSAGIGSRLRRQPSQGALAAMAGAATLLRALARDGDRLWTPGPIAPGRMTGVPGLPLPELETGPLAALAPAATVLAWCETPAVSQHRGNGPPHLAGPFEPLAPLSPLALLAPLEPLEKVPLHELLWELAGEGAPTAGHRDLAISPAQDRAHPAAPLQPILTPPWPPQHRGFALEVARGLGHAPGGARLISSLAELEAHLAAGGTKGAAGDLRKNGAFGDPSPSGASGDRLQNGASGDWVLKAPFSAAGRARLMGHGAAALREVAVRQQVERLLAQHGQLLFEPWVERVDDFGCAALLGLSGVRVVSCHRQRVDARGRFLGIVTSGCWPGWGGCEGLSRAEQEALGQAVLACARALRKRGYLGPFGIDAWRYRRPDGALAFQPLGELNARMTMGLVARALIDRVREPLAIGAEDRVELAFGTHLPSSLPVVPLVGPHPAGGGASWLVIQKRQQRQQGR